MSTHSVSVHLKKGGAAQVITSLAMEAPHELYVLIRNVGEGNADVAMLGGSAGPATMEPHTARLVVLAKGGALTAKCSSADTYTVLLLDLKAATELDPV